MSEVTQWEYRVVEFQLDWWENGKAEDYMNWLGFRGWEYFDKIMMDGKIFCLFMKPLTKALVYADIQYFWDLLALESSSIAVEGSLLWDMRELVRPNLNLAWDVPNLVTRDIETPYNMRAVVGSGLMMPWDIIATVQGNAFLEWNVDGSVSRALEVTFDSRQIVGNNSTVAYTLGDVVQGQVGLNWAVKSLVQKHLDMRYDTRVTVGQQDEFRWRVR